MNVTPTIANMVQQEQELTDQDFINIEEWYADDDDFHGGDVPLISQLQQKKQPFCLACHLYVSFPFQL